MKLGTDKDIKPLAFVFECCIALGKVVMEPPILALALVLFVFWLFT